MQESVQYLLWVIAVVRESRFKLVLNSTDALDVLLSQNLVLDTSLNIAPNQSVFFSSIILQTWLLSQVVVEVSVWKIAGRALK